MLESLTDDDIEKMLLRKLFKLGCWGKGHVCESNLPKSFPSHIRKRVLRLAKKLRKDGYLVMRPSSHDRQWYLNPHKLAEIEERMKPLN